jgi:hypothetical protein
VESEKLLQDLTHVSSRFSNNRYSGGAYDRFLQSVSVRYFDGPDSLLTFNPLDAGGNQIMSGGYRSMNTLYRYQKRVYLQEDGRDLLNAIFSDKGDLEKTYVWFGQVRDRIQMFTPGYWTGKVMDRTHGLGLVYKGDDVVPLHPIFNKNPLIRKHTFTENFNVTLGGVSTKVSGKFEGGKHLEHFCKAWKRAEDGKLVGVGVGTGVTYSINPDHHIQALFDAINGKVTNVGTLGVGMNYVTGSVGDMGGMLADWNKFRTALQNSGLPFQFDGAGNLTNNAHNKALLDGMFKRIGIRKINSASIDPFVSRVGLLQIYASKLSLVQRKIFSRVGKFIDPWVHLRTAAAKKVGDAAAKIISKLALRAGLTALGAATAGIATALAPIIEKVMQAVVSRVIDKSKALVRAVLKGDFSGELDKMMNDAMKATEKVITCGCFVPIFLAFAGFMMMGNIIVSISPVDKAKQAISAVVGLVTVDRPDPVTSDNCIADAFYVSCNSYDTGDQDHSPCRHGDNGYWSAGRQCKFNIPYFAGNPARGPASDPTSVCSSVTPKKPYYGYALDVVPADPDNAWVYAPQIGSVTNWDISVRRVDQKACPSCSEWIGCSVTLSGNDGTHNYRIFLLHLACTTLPELWVGSVDPGYPLAQLYDYIGGKHVHIEMMVDGSYVKPETYMCN